MDQKDKQTVIQKETQVMEGFRRYLEHAIAVNQREKEETDRQVAGMLKQYNDQNVDLFDQISVGLSMQELYDQTLKQYRKALKAPFFARIDFQEEGTSTPVPSYIGKTGVNDRDKGEALIVDWRAPMANLYYNGELGRTSYTCLEGEIQGELSLKRTFTLEEGRIADYYDSDLVTNDELLQEYLAKNADVVLKDIVATIQKDQNQIIRVDPWVNVIVQGVAGSGKTTVAIHRISYILYTFPDRYRPEQMVIIGASRMFLGYVAGMLPELGVENITQAVLPDFLLELAKEGNPGYRGKCRYLPYLEEGGGQEGLAAAYKSSLDFCRKLDRFVRDFGRSAFPLEDVTFYHRTVLTGKEVVDYGRDGVAKTLLEKRDMLKTLIASRMRQLLPEMVEEDQLERYGFPLDPAGNLPRQRQAIADTIKKQGRQLKNHFDRAFRGLSGFRLYHLFLEGLSQSSRNQEREAGMLSLSHCKKGDYDLYDLCAVLYLTTHLQPVERLGSYRHLVVDEAQDFSPSVFWCLERSIPQASFTLMGDTSQNLGEYTGLGTWEILERQVFAQRKLAFFSLTKSYRNTIEIAQVANTVLQHLRQVQGEAPYVIDPVVRHGQPVTFTSCKDREELAKGIKASLAQFAKEGYKTTAIICKTVQECQALYPILTRLGVPVHLIQDAKDPYSGGVTLFPVQFVKGMEFDTVVLADAGREQYGLSPLDIRLLYVAVTRGLHCLHIYSLGDLSLLFGQSH